MDSLNEDTYIMYAIKHYNNPNCTGYRDFQEDLNHIKYLKRLFRRYDPNKSDSKLVRLVLNHLILLYNVFDGEAMTRILFYKVSKKHYPLLKTFLIKLSRMPDYVRINDDNILISDEIPMITDLFSPLREI
tara:strand:+ start:11 stop:403 length:393 start_codon:yes stop_codon:yes gene_type:complete